MKNTLLWILALVITLGAAVYQRMTGPTYPIRGKATLAGTEISFRLLTSAENVEDCKIKIETPDPGVEGFLTFRRFKTDDAWTDIPMIREEQTLVGILPAQPAAGKLEYKVSLQKGNETVSLSGDDPVVIRFKGAVPLWALLPHVLIMFLAMLFSTRTGLEALRPNSNPRKLVIWTFALLFVGGMILGPLVQKFAFGALWTGFPFGTDLTDNKTLIAFVAWLAALIAGRKGRPARGWALVASIILMAVYLIPHSLLGSELDYSQMN